MPDLVVQQRLEGVPEGVSQVQVRPLAALELVLRRTVLGKRIRAEVEKRERAKGKGIYIVSNY